MGWYGQGRGTLAIVLTAPVIATTSLPNATAGSPYTSMLSAIHGQPPYTFTLLSGADGNGFPACSSSGVLSGTPVSDETLTLVFQVTDSLNVPSAPASLTLSVVGVVPQIVNATLPNATVNGVYSTTLSAINGQPPYTYTILSGRDVNGFPACSASGTLSGTPTSIESLNLVIQVTDTLGSVSAPTSLTLGVTAARTQFYISSTAPNTNIGTGFGTLANPWNIAAINDPTSRLMYAGQQITFLNGVYNVNAIVNSTTGNDLGPCYNIEGGTATSPTIVTSQTQRGAQFNGFANNDGVTYPTNGRAVMGQAFVPATGQTSVNNMGNVVIDGFYFTGGNGGFVVYDAEGMPGAGTVTGWVFQNCETFSTTGDASGNLGHFKTRFANGVIVQNNLIHGTYSSTGTLANSSLVFSFNSINGVYQHNTLYDSPTGIHLKNIHQNNDTIQFNYIELNGPTGAQTTPTNCLQDCTGGDVGTTTTVQNNIMVVPATAPTTGVSWWFGSDAQNPPTFQNSATYSSIVFANNTCISNGQSGLFIQCVGNQVGPPGGPGGTTGSPSAKHHMYNNIFLTSGAWIVSTANGTIGQCSGTDCQGTQDYNLWSSTNPTTFSLMQTRPAAAFSELTGPTSQGTLAQCRTNLGVEVHSANSTYAAASLFTAPNISLNPTGYQLASGSAAKGLSRVGGVVTGTACDAGAWGGPSPPSQIGASFFALNTAWQTLKVGSGGYVRGMTMAADGTLVGRTDTNGAYLYNSTTSTWNQLCTSASLPSAVVNATDIAVIGQGCYEIAIAPSNTNTLYMAYAGYVFSSLNQGSTWSQTGFTQNAAGMNPNTNPYSEYGQKMAVDPNNANIVYVGTSNNGLYVSSNGGGTFAHVTGVPTSTNAGGITGICFDPNAGVTGGVTQTIYACSNGNGVYRSTNGGTAWTLLTGSPATVINAQIDGTSNYYAVTSAGVSRCTASAWTQLLANSGNACQAIAVNPFNNAEVVSVDVAGYIQQSTNSGTSWSAKNFSDTITATDIPWLQAANNETPPVFFLQVGGAQFSPITNGLLICSAGTGMWKMTVPTTVGSTVVNWTDFSVGIEQLVANEIVVPPNATSTPLLASWDRPIFQITDIPENNVYPSTYFPVANNTIQAGWSIDYASSNPQFIAAIVYYNSAESCFSTNGGSSWTSFPTMYASALGGCIACSTPSNIIWAPAGGATPAYTTNGGTSWTALSISGITSWSGFMNTYFFKQRPVCADRVTANTFYLYFPGKGVYISSNGGATWTQQLAGYIESNHSVAGNNARISAVPGQAGNLFYTSGNVGGTTPNSPVNIPFYRSTNGGATWTAVPNVIAVTTFGFGASAPEQTYPAVFISGFVNSVFGIWRSDDNCNTWTQLASFPGGNLDLVCTISGDPNNYGVCYIGYAGGGYGCLLP